MNGNTQIIVIEDNPHLTGGEIKKLENKGYSVVKNGDRLVCSTCKKETILK